MEIKTMMKATDEQAENAQTECRLLGQRDIAVGWCDEHATPFFICQRHKVENRVVQLTQERDFLSEQIKQLGKFLLDRYPSQPGRVASEGAVECAIRLLSLDFK